MMDQLEFHSFIFWSIRFCLCNTKTGCSTISLFIGDFFFCSATLGDVSRHIQWRVSTTRTLLSSDFFFWSATLGDVSRHIQWLLFTTPRVFTNPPLVSVTSSHFTLSGPRGQLSGCGGILMTTSLYSRCRIALYMYKEDLIWVWSGWGVSILRTNRDPPPTPRKSTLRSQVPESRYQVGVASLWPLATAAGAETLYLCMK